MGIGAVQLRSGAAAAATRRIAEDVAQRLAHPFPAGAYRAQLYAARLHNCLGRLSRDHRCRR